ncbi:hypothetical protein BC829DRAFT_435529 [Chytridium lagenaria]|nr:hypothetical protein BC829DRAFT_435529 [Chytridium lagenaria]
MRSFQSPNLIFYLTLISVFTALSVKSADPTPPPLTSTAPSLLIDCFQYRNLCMGMSSNETDTDGICQSVNSTKTPIAGICFSKSTGKVYLDVPVPKTIEMPIPLVGPSGNDPSVGCAGFGNVCGGVGGVSFLCTTTGNPSASIRNVTGVVETLPPYHAALCCGEDDDGKNLHRDCVDHNEKWGTCG